ncbi:MAG TPA: WD40 repeat domain-containing protein [Gemmataceae bacterium]|jgi:WD40 repeat protein
MWIHKRKSIAGLLLLLGVLAARTGWAAHHEETPPPQGKQAHTDRYGDPLPDGVIKRFGSTRLRHIGPVAALAWSPDGKLLASCGRDDGTVRLWDAATGRLVRSFKYRAFCLTFTPDGKGLAAGLDGQVCVWEVATGKESLRLDALNEKLRRLANQRPRLGWHGGVLVDGQMIDERWRPDTKAVAFSPDGRRLAAGGNHAATVWDIRTGKKCFAVGDDWTPHVAFTSDGKRLITGDLCKSVGIWDAQTGKRISGFETEGPERTVNLFRLAICPDDKHAALKLLDQVVIVELASGKIVWREKAPGQDNDPVAFSPDGRLFAFVNKKGVRIWEWTRGRQIAALREGGEMWRWACVFAPDGKRLAWAGFDGNIRIWNLAGRKETPFLEGHRGGIGLFALRPDGKALVTTDLAGTVRLWDTASGRVSRAIPLVERHPADCLAFSRDGHRLILGDYRSTLTEMDLSGEEKPHSRTGPVEKHYVVALAPGGETAAATDGHFTLTHWITGGGRDWHEQKDAPIRLYDATFTPDGKRLIVNSDDHIVYLDAATGRTLWRTEKSGMRFNSNLFRGSLVGSPDGRFVAAGGQVKWGAQDACMHLFDVETGREHAKLPTPYPNIHAAAFSPDNRFLIAASTPYNMFASDQSADAAKRVLISLWEVASGAEIRRFHGHEWKINALAFAPDGRTFYSASTDGTVLQWDAFGLRDTSAARPGQVDGLWDDLAESDAAKAYRAVARLVASPRQACTLLDKHLQPTQAVSSERLTALIRDLDSERFAAREAAMRELRYLGEQADGALRAALQNHPPLEVRRRVEALLEERRARPYSPDELRRCRTVLVLEWIGSAEARVLLERLAGGTAAVSHVRDARAALKRLQEQVKGR